MKNKKERLILSITLFFLIGILAFSIFEWEIISYLFKQVVSGASIVKEYVLSLGVLGVIAITHVIVMLFFFPIISCGSLFSARYFVQFSDPAEKIRDRRLKIHAILTADGVTERFANTLQRVVCRCGE